MKETIQPSELSPGSIRVGAENGKAGTVTIEWASYSTEPGVPLSEPGGVTLTRTEIDSLPVIHSIEPTIEEGWTHYEYKTFEIFGKTIAFRKTNGMDDGHAHSSYSRFNIFIYEPLPPTLNQ